MNTEQSQNLRSGRKLTVVSSLHYFRLVYRAALFLSALVIYIVFRVRTSAQVESFIAQRPVILTVIWVVFMVEMIMRFIPSRFESPGSQKQFRRNYVRSGKTDIDIQDNHGTMLVAIIWITFNGVFGALYMANILDEGIMILLSCLFSVCDMICILFFCPFQTWFLKNKCCSTCRIYNWDYAMMFTPLFFVKSFYSWTLLAMSILLLLRWEITFYRAPERFSETTNEYLHCKNCTEKLCAHKKQLRSVWKDISETKLARLRFLLIPEDGERKED